MSNKDQFTQTGITTDDKPVFAGVFSFYETHGLPLNVVFQCFIDKGWMVDWIDFYLSAIKAGMKHDRVLSKLEEAISDSFGKDCCQYVISKLDEVFGHPKPIETDKLLSKIKNVPQTYVANVDWTEDDIEIVASSLEEAREKFRAINPNWEFICVIDVLDITPKETK